jgi:hypothetical protein
MFISETAKFKRLEEHLGENGKRSLSTFKESARRIQWNLYKEEDVAQFRAKVASRTDAAADVSNVYTTTQFIQIHKGVQSNATVSCNQTSFSISSKSSVGEHAI